MVIALTDLVVRLDPHAMLCWVASGGAALRFFGKASTVRCFVFTLWRFNVLAAPVSARIATVATGLRPLAHVILGLALGLGAFPGAFVVVVAVGSVGDGVDADFGRRRPPNVFGSFTLVLLLVEDQAFRPMRKATTSLVF